MKDKLGAVVCFVAVGFFMLLIYMMMYMERAEDRSLIIICCGALAAVSFGAALIAVLNETLFYHIRLRRKALRSLGKDGIKAVINDDTARLAFKGIYYFHKGDYAKAEEKLMLALDRSDNRNNQVFCTEWLYNLYEETSNDPRRLWAMRKAVEYSPDSVPAQLRLGHRYYADGNLENAMYCFKQAIKYDPINGYASYMIAKIHMIQGRDDEAIATLEGLLKSNESHPLVHAELAIFHAINKNDEQSREHYQKAIMCGYDDPHKLSAQITAINDFNNAEGATLDDLPSDYYRHIEKGEESNA